MSPTEGITVDSNPETKTVTFTCHRCGATETMTFEAPIKEMEGFHETHQRCQTHDASGSCHRNTRNMWLA